MQSGRSVKWTLTLALFRCPHAYPSASSPFTLTNKNWHLGGDRVVDRIGAEASNWAVFDGWLAGQPVFLGTTKAKGRVARDEGFPTGEMVGSKGGRFGIRGDFSGWILIRSGNFQIKNRPLTSFLVEVWSLKVSWLSRWSWMAENTWCLHRGFHVFVEFLPVKNDPIWSSIIFVWMGSFTTNWLGFVFYVSDVQKIRMDKSHGMND